MKRFYKQVAVEAADAGWRLTLDGRPLSTPARRPWVAPNQAVAEAAAEEWDRQTDEVDPRSMPVTQFVGTSLDRIADHREVIVTDLVGYGGRDLLCYRADAPPDLVSRQTESWDPLLDWLADTLGPRLVTTQGILPIDQPEDALARLRDHLNGSYSDLELTALHNATTVLGSLVLALALAEGRLDPEQAFNLSRLDEDYQEQRWGQDGEAAARAEILRREILECHRLLELAAQ